MADQIVNKEMQYYLRVLSVFIGALLNAKWYRTNYPDGKNIFLLVIVAVVLGLYFINI